ncbi:MAG: copper resistance protein NlpE N-terminal domain-containing protein [Balneolaceae bacterium]|nr:copper resistance protein NlpE N-terminal domain-containing protein [Balneolaceae bacterium]
MERAIYVWLAVTLSVLVMGCIDEQQPTQSELGGASYTGVIPCADCEGIAYKLMLKEDSRFETTSVYIGKSNRPFTERGTWSLQGDSLLLLNKSEEHPRKFKIKNDQLIMLNQQGNEVSGSLSRMYVLNESDSANADIRWKDRRKRGIDFRAAGNEPSWSLDIDFDKMMTFKTLNGDSISTPIPEMSQDTASKARIWNAEVESGSLKVELYPTGCVDDMSGEVFNYYANVSYNGQQYSGCGNFINATYKLNDFWQLHTLNQSEIDTGEVTRQVPALQFDIAKDKVYGNTGCNQLNGNVAIADSSLSFSKIITTKMACQGNVEPRFLKAMKIVSEYEISDAELLLLSSTGDTLMTFRRAE